MCRLRNNLGNAVVGSLKEEGIITTNGDDYGYIEFYISNAEDVTNGLGAVIDNIMAFEYQEGMENWDILYFEGMASVKVPVLKVVGKNLFDFSINNIYTTSSKTEYAPTFNEDGSITINSCYDNPYWLKHGFYVKKGKEYTVTVKGMKSGGYSSLCFGFDNLKYIDSGAGKVLIPAKTAGNCIDTVDVYGTKSMTCTALETGYITRFYIHGSDNTPRYTILDFQVEESPIATELEHHKTNSITTPNDLELRGIGNVKDSLDITLGEKVERIGEIVLDGSEERWELAQDRTNTMRFNCFSLEIPYGVNGSLLKTDKLPYQSPTTDDREGAVMGGGNTPKIISISVMKNKLSSETLEGFKEWLANNNLTIQYVLTEPTKTKVELSSNVVYSYKDTTHYSFGVPDNSLIPTLSIDVPTNLPAVVTRQNNTITQLENENKALKTEIKETSNSSVNGELMSQQFDLDFRIFEIETTLDIPTQLNLKGAKNMAMTVFQQAQTLILAGKYERTDMEYKLKRYLDKNRITKTEYDELISMMDAQELMN